MQFVALTWPLDRRKERQKCSRGYRNLVWMDKKASVSIEEPNRLPGPFIKLYPRVI